MSVIEVSRQAKNSSIDWSDDPHPIDLIARNASCGFNPYLVVRANVLERAEERVAVAGDSTVSRLSGKSGSLNMSYTEP